MNSPPGRQHTLARPVAVEGIGLHSGAPVRATLHAAPAGSGVVFQCASRPGAPLIPACLDAVAGTTRGVVLGAGDARIGTAEHLLSACAGLEVDNLLVVIEGEELPAGDGSARPFVAAIREAGIVEQQAPRAALSLAEPVWVGDRGAIAVALPWPVFRATYVVEHPVVGAQVAEYDAGADAYEEAVAGARTWGMLDEAEALRRHGLARGASLQNTLVLSEAGYVNAPRYPNELARHKLLDLIGDLYLLGALQARIIAVRAGHDLHVALGREIIRRAHPVSDPARSPSG